MHGILTTQQALAKVANMDYNYFIRTTEPAHKESVQYFWVRGNAPFECPKAGLNDRRKC
jgi:methionyl-tRNA synthetase